MYGTYEYRRRHADRATETHTKYQIANSINKWNVPIEVWSCEFCFISSSRTPSEHTAWAAMARGLVAALSYV